METKLKLVIFRIAIKQSNNKAKEDRNLFAFRNVGYSVDTMSRCCKAIGQIRKKVARYASFQVKTVHSKYSIG